MEVLCSGCCLMWLFYRYFYKFSGVICGLGSTFPVLLEQGVCVSLPELLWQCWWELQSCSPQSQVRRGTSTAFPDSSHIPGAALPLGPPQELQLLVQFLCSPKRGTIPNLSWQSCSVTCPKGTQVLEGNFVHKSALVWVFCWFSLRI